MCLCVCVTTFFSSEKHPFLLIFFSLLQKVIEVDYSIRTGLTVCALVLTLSLTWGSSDRGLWLEVYGCDCWFMFFIKIDLMFTMKFLIPGSTKLLTFCNYSVYKVTYFPSTLILN